MTSFLQQTRYDQLIRRVGAIVGPGSKVSEALSELFPVIDVERVPGELLILGQTNLCLGSSTVLGAAGETPRIQLFNPAASGKLISISTCIISSLQSQEIRFATTTTALTTGVGTEVFRDRRLSATGRPSGQIRTDSTVARTDANGAFRTLANSPRFLEDLNTVAVLPPDTGFEVGAVDFATQIWVTFFWRERVAEQSELLFS